MDYRQLAGDLFQIFLDSSNIKVTRELKNLISPNDILLSYLKTQGGRAYPKEFSNEFKLSTARIAVMLNGLERDGYVERRPDDRDKRQTLVLLCEKGDARITDIYQELIGRFAELLERMGEHDAEEYYRLQLKFFSLVSDYVG